MGSDAFVEKLQRVGVNVTAVNRQLMESGQKANQAVAGNAMATSSIAAQFNDIGVMMASGQNPLIMAIQQGTQLSQALGPAGAAGKLAALRAGFMAFLSPTTLATIALIAGAGALVQWGMKAVGAGRRRRRWLP
ncbi:MAG: phage tail length tape measure family protein [Exiguobacterium profundum]|nr:MAG: phage tail length tape measure family protein [Exiguobacterium profundum]